MKRFTANKFTAGLANFLSTALSPLLMPTYGVFMVLWVSVLCLLPYGTRVSVLLVEKREQRFFPYMFTALCYTVAAYYLYYCHSPQWFVMFMVGSAVTVLIMALINLKWKISAHMAGIGGVVALVYQIHVQGLSAFDLFWMLCITIMVAGLLGSARLVLNRHDAWQVLAGVVVGFLSVSLTMRFFG